MRTFLRSFEPFSQPRTLVGPGMLSEATRANGTGVFALSVGRWCGRRTPELGTWIRRADNSLRPVSGGHTSNEGRDYLGLKLDDPSFNAPIYANLFDDEEGETFSLIWSRPNGRRGD